MRPGPGIRIVHLLVAGLFLSTLGGDALGAHPCPHHDAVMGRGSPMDAGHASGGAVHEPGSPSHDSGESHGGPCTCVGQCTLDSGVAFANAPPA